MCREDCKNVLKIVIAGGETQARAQGHAQKQIINCKNAFNVRQIYLLLINAFLQFFFYVVCSNKFSDHQSGRNQNVTDFL